MSLELKKVIASTAAEECISYINQCITSFGVKQVCDELCCVRKGYLTAPLPENKNEELSMLGLSNWIDRQGFKSFSALDMCVFKDDDVTLKYVLDMLDDYYKNVEEDNNASIRLRDNVQIALFHNMGLALTLGAQKSIGVYHQKGLLLRCYGIEFMQTKYDELYSQWYQLRNGIEACDWVRDLKIQQKIFKKDNPMSLWYQKWVGACEGQKMNKENNFLFQSLSQVEGYLPYGGVKSSDEMKAWCSRKVGPWFWSIRGMSHALLSLSENDQKAHWLSALSYVKEDKKLGFCALHWLNGVWIDYVGQKSWGNIAQRSSQRQWSQTVFEELIEHPISKEKDSKTVEHLIWLKDQHILERLVGPDLGSKKSMKML